MSGTEIAYRLHADATPEMELSTLTNVYRFILDCHPRKEGGPTTAPNDEKVRSSNDSLAIQNYTR